MNRELLQRVLGELLRLVNNKANNYTFVLIEDLQSEMMKEKPEQEPVVWLPLYASPQQPPAKPTLTFNGWYCPHCETGVDPSDVTFSEHHQVCGTFIGDTEPPELEKPDPVAWKESIIEHLQSLYDTDGITDNEGDPLIYLNDAICAIDEHVK
ncbi:MAG: hypothetical protein WAW61_22250 [Methylococcaceae bacterium]